MTPEERYRLMTQNQPGMVNQSAQDMETAARDLSAQNRRLAQQQARARQLMDSSTQSPGLIRAGNMVVAGANPLSAMAQAIRGGAGAYLSAKTGKAQAGLDQEQALIDAAAGRVAADERDYARGQNDIRNRMQQERIDMEGRRLEDAAAEREAARARTQAAAEAAQRQHEEKMRLYWARLGLAPDGTTPLPGGVPGRTSSATADEGEVTAGDRVNRALTTSNLMLRTDPEIQYRATGLNPAALLGPFNLPGIERGKEIQDFQRNIMGTQFQIVSPILKELDLKPVTEGEYERTAKGAVGPMTDPYGMVSAHATNIYPYVRSQLEAAVKEGTHTQADLEAFDKQYQADIVYGALQPDTEKNDGTLTMPLSQLEDRGIDVVSVRDDLAQKVATGTATAEERDMLERLIMARLQERQK